MLRSISTGARIFIERGELDGPVTHDADFCEAFWFRPEAWPTDTFVKIFQIDGFFTIKVRHDTGDRVRLIMFTALDGGNALTLDASITIRTGEWHLVTVSWVESTKTMTLRARNETDAMAKDSGVAAAYTQFGTDHHVWMFGRSGEGSMQGIMSAPVFRSHITTDADFASLWNSGAPNVGGAMEDDNFENSTGSDDVVWHGPGGTRTGHTNPAFLGDDVDANGENLALGTAGDLSGNIIHGLEVFADYAGAHTATTGVDAIQFVNVLDDTQAYGGFFVGRNPGYAPATPYVECESANLNRIVNGQAASGVQRVMVGANSRVARTSDDSIVIGEDTIIKMQSLREAVIRNLGERCIGFMMTAFCEGGGGGHNGEWTFIRNSYKSSNSAVVVSTPDAHTANDPSASFGRFAMQTTNNNQNALGCAVYIPDGESAFFGMVAEEGTGHSDKADDVIVEVLVLRFPGAGVAEIVGQHRDASVASPTDIVTFDPIDAGGLGSTQHTMVGADSYVSGTKTLTLDGVTGLGLSKGSAVHVSGGTGARGCNVVESASEVSGDTVIVFQMDCLFGDLTTGSVLEMGGVTPAKGGGTITGIADSRTIAGLNVTADGGPVVVIAHMGRNAEAANGYVVGSWGRSGTGYSNQIALSYKNGDDALFWIEYMEDPSWILFKANQGDTDGDTVADMVDMLETASQNDILVVLDPEYAEDYDVGALHDGAFTHVESMDNVGLVDISNRPTNLGDRNDLLERNYFHNSAHINSLGADAIVAEAFALAQSAVTAPSVASLSSSTSLGLADALALG